MSARHEVAGKTYAKAMELAARYGYGQPLFTRYVGPLCIVTFARKNN